MTVRDPDELTLPPDGRPADEQPQWRRDFPVDVPQDQYVARREFTKFLVLTSFAFVAGQAWILAKSLLGRRSSSPEAAIARLDEDQRVLVVLRDIEGLAYDEIVESTELAEGTGKSRLHRAREKLAVILGELETEAVEKGE